MTCKSLALVTVLVIALLHNAVSLERAPQITTQLPRTDFAYKKHEDQSLPCQASGNPTPQYIWKKDGVVLDLSGSHYSLQPGTGNLNIRKPTKADDGHYQCLARNKFGTAVGLKLRLDEAVIEAFPSSDVQMLNPTVGESLKMICRPPIVYPKGTPYFGYNKPSVDSSANKLENIQNDDRVLLDYDGNLYFANVIMNDSLNNVGDKTNYLCVVNNPLLGAYVQGNDYRLVPRDIRGSPTPRAPHLMWPTSQSAVAILGQTKFLKCIFGGYPTPRVTWTWSGSGTPFVETEEGRGTEIKFTKVRLEDEGYYTCAARNSASDRPVTHSIKLTVQSPPFWNRQPVDQDVDEESDIEVDCQVHGTPKPNITWAINGLEVNESHFTGRKSLESNKLRYRNVTVNDSQVIQCMAANEHGTILVNVILTVNAEQPSFLETPSDKKVVVGTTHTMKCNTRGAPKPKVTWTRGKPPRQVSGRRFVVHTSGALEIKDADLEDTDIYRCVASNKHGTNDASANLIVRSPTEILSKSSEKDVLASEEVFIPCDVVTDREEMVNLQVEWRKNGVPIDFKAESHMYMDKTDHSLRIRSAKVLDTADYTCNASNGLDAAESGVSKLTVRDRPDPPHSVNFFHCGTVEAGITWRAGNDNNEPITRFTVFYNDSNGSGKNATLETPDRPIPNEEFRLNVPVKPYSRYTVYITATNNVGTSRFSDSNGVVCTTPQEAPHRNPDNVCGKLKGQTQLVITWDPMPESEHYGEGFHYIVGYKRYRSSEQVKEVKVTNPRENQLTIHHVQSFTKFEVYVQAANNKGLASFRYSKKRLVYSGEGIPQDAPKNFNLANNKFNGSFAEFTWESVDESVERVRGFFRGYQIIFWRAEDRHTTRSEDIILDRQFKLCEILETETDGAPGQHPTAAYRFRRNHRLHIRATGDPVYGTTNKLWPLSKIQAAVRVINQAQGGELSNIIEFFTPEGAPGKIRNLSVIERGSSHLLVEWLLPIESSGKISHFALDYHVAPPAVGQTMKVIIEDPTRTKFKIRRLDYSTRYQISVSAVTGGGVGEPEIVFGETLPHLELDAPKIGAVTTTDNSANVSWFPSEKQPAENPGSDFYVEYRRADTNPWQRVNPDPDSYENWVNITDLDKGPYDIRVVAVSDSRENRSAIKTVNIGGPIEPEPSPEPVVLQHASTGWFIILMCIIALLLLILVVVCIMRRARGDMYPVYEKEKMWRHHPLAPDETPFGEYTPPSDHPTLSKSQGSIDSDEKPMDSDSDSLGEYEDQDASKFNEDGSFIGQYSGKNKPDSNRQSTVNTSV